MIRTDRRGVVTIVVIDRPERRNALDDAHERQLADALRDAADDPVVRAIVLTGVAGAFCAGADLRDRLPAFQAAVAGGAEPDWSFGGITGARPLRVPIVVAIDGPAIAGGLELALAGDIRICSPRAVFAMAETRWAITPGAGGSVRLPRIVGESTALDLLLTARTMDAEEALQTGLVSRLVPEEEIVESAVAVAEAVAGNGPLAVAAVRRVARAAGESGLADALRRERASFYEVMRSADAAEGSSAFAHKRAPVYQGR